MWIMRIFIGALFIIGSAGIRPRVAYGTNYLQFSCDGNSLVLAPGRLVSHLRTSDLFSTLVDITLTNIGKRQAVIPRQSIPSGIDQLTYTSIKDLFSCILHSCIFNLYPATTIPSDVPCGLIVTYNESRCQRSMSIGQGGGILIFAYRNTVVTLQDEQHGTVLPPGESRLFSNGFINFNNCEDISETFLFAFHVLRSDTSMTSSSWSHAACWGESDIEDTTEIVETSPHWAQSSRKHTKIFTTTQNIFPVSSTKDTGNGASFMSTESNPPSDSPVVNDDKATTGGGFNALWIVVAVVIILIIFLIIMAIFFVRRYRRQSKPASYNTSFELDHQVSAQNRKNTNQEEAQPADDNRGESLIDDVTEGTRGNPLFDDVIGDTLGDSSQRSSLTIVENDLYGESPDLHQ